MTTAFEAILAIFFAPLEVLLPLLLCLYVAGKTRNVFRPHL